MPLTNYLKIFSSGTAGSSLIWHDTMAFSTHDRDNDHHDEVHCANNNGGWWYSSWLMANLNGLYLHGEHSSYADGVNWYHWKGLKYSAKRAEMKIRPADF